MASPWGRLSQGQPIGKSVQLPYDASSTRRQRSQEPLLQVAGDDADAQQIVVTFAAPRVVRTPFSYTLATNLPPATTEQSNLEVGSANFPGTGAPIAWPPVDAIVEWGTGGAQAQAVLDWRNGSSLSVVASWLRVHAEILSGPEIGVSGTSAIYVLSAFAGPGFIRQGTARKTTYLSELAPGAESPISPVPRFADRAYVVGLDASSPPVLTSATLRFWQSPDGTNSAGNVVVTGAQPTPFDVPSVAAYASIVNGMAVASRFAIIYTLSI